ncbi:hypothetical protein BC829DRAFT_205331 [Chytridium lagenaria]|nr:hypothetical protein BC829DRAFT_205331 [Chytridium lagenaria]
MKFNREKASEIGQSITDIEKRIEDAHRRRNQIENVEISQVSAEIRSLEVEMQELQKLKDNLSRLDIERNNIEKNIREFQDIKVLSENTNELYSILENYNDSFQRIARESKSLEDQIPFLEGDLKRKENNLLDVLRDKGKFEAEKQVFIAYLKKFLH